MGRAVILVVMSYFEGFAAAVSASRAQATAAGISGGSGQAPEIRLLSEGEGGSLSRMITDSFVRNGVKVPSSLSQLLPKLQAVCPRVSRACPSCMPGTQYVVLHAP